MPPGHLLVAGVSGLAVTVLEFAAVRLMAPSFGQSNYVWANVIGIILLALSLGYWFGGRLADRSRTGRRLYLAYVLAAAYITAIAFLGDALCRWLVPEGIGSQRVLPLAFTGSLVATIVLFGPPTLVLGMTSPFLIRLDDRPGAAGRVSGRIFAVGTLGSLLGCYVAPLWLLQAAGTRATMLLSAAALTALAVGGLASAGRRRPATAAAGFLAALLATLGVAAVVGLPALRVEAGQIAEIESTYQSIRVVEQEVPLLAPGPVPLYGEAATARTRFLRHDEDADTYQSVWLPDDAGRWLTGGRYYEHLALGALFARPADAAPSRLRVLILGYAGGSFHRTLKAIVPEDVVLEVVGVEIDPAVVAAAREHLALDEVEDEHTRLITGEDARTVVNALPPEERFDLVLLDAYARTTYIPFQLATVEFFEALGEHLAAGGWLGINLHAPEGVGGPLHDAIAATLEASMGPAFSVPNPHYPGSVAMWCRPRATDGPPARAPRLRADLLPPPAVSSAVFALERLLVRARPPAGTRPLTDDRSRVDALSDEELFGR